MGAGASLGIDEFLSIVIVSFGEKGSDTNSP